MTQGPTVRGGRPGAEDPVSAARGSGACGVGVDGPAGSRLAESGLSGSFESLFRVQFPTMFRLAHLLGADDPEDVARRPGPVDHTAVPWASGSCSCRNAIPRACDTDANHNP